MNRQRGFTLLELAAVAVVLALVLAIIPSMGRPARRTARAMQNSTHVAGIHKGMILYAQGNRGWYPGLTASGTRDTRAIPAGPSMYGTNSTDGFEPVYRVAILLRNNFFSPEYVIAPAEVRLGTKPGDIQTPAVGIPMGTGLSYSYAMLRIDQNTARREEWSATNSAEAPVVSDRNIGAATGINAQSVHTAVGDGWRGSVAYNDNHTVFETSSVVRTIFRTYTRDTAGNTKQTQQHAVALDDLFADDKDDKGMSGNDAGMVFQDPTTYVGQ